MKASDWIYCCKDGRVFFVEEVRPYKIRSMDDRFLICTKPFNLRHTVLYCIVDTKEEIRGTENLVFGFGAETDEQCEEMLKRLQDGETEVSHRNRIPLRIFTIHCP